MKFLFLFLLSTAFWGVENTTPAIDAPSSNILKEHAVTSEDTAEVFPGEAVMCCQASVDPLIYTSSSVIIPVNFSGGETNANAPGVDPLTEFSVWVNGAQVYNRLPDTRSCAGGFGNNTFSTPRSLYGDCPDLIRVDVRTFSVSNTGSLVECSYDRFYIEERLIYNGSDGTTCDDPGNPTGPGGVN